MADVVELESFLIVALAPLWVPPWLLWCGWAASCDWRAHG